MKFWAYDVYADRGHSTVCYAASVRAKTEREAVEALIFELKFIPMPLYIGPLQGSGFVQKAAQECTVQTTENSEIRLVRVDQ